MTSKFLRLLLDYIIFSLGILLVFLVIFEKYLSFPGLVRWMGHWHPIILHFPIVLIFITIIQFVRRDPHTSWYLGTTVLLSLVASVTGFILSTEQIEKGSRVLLHQWLSIGLTGIVFIWWKYGDIISKGKYLISVLQVLAVVLILFTGHVGGTITHGNNFLNPLSGNKKEKIIAENPAIYGAFVQPILDEKCTKCHNANKSKGKLILSDYVSVAAGGESGPAFDFNNLNQSNLLHHLHLPLDDDGHMPPSDEKQLSEEELMVIEEWVAAGASDTLSVAGLRQTGRLYNYSKSRMDMKSGADYTNLPSVSDVQLEQLSSNYISISRLYHGINALSVIVYPSLSYNSGQLKKMGAISRNIVSLNMSNLAIGDDEIAFIRSCKNLESLNLSQTEIDDRMFAGIGKLDKLKILNAYNTPLSEASVPIIASFPLLKELIIFRSPLAEQGSEKLKRSFSQLTVIDESSQAKEFESVLPAVSVSPAKPFFIDPFKISLTHPLAEINIFYTIDGSNPTITSARYNDSILIDNSTVIKFFAAKEGWHSSRIDSVRMFRSTEPPDRITLLHPADVKYSGRSAVQLIDRIKGPESFSDSAWMGFRNQDFVLRCEWDEAIILNDIVLSSILKTDSYLFPPEAIIIRAGRNKQDLKTVYAVKPAGLRDRKDAFPQYYVCSFEEREVNAVEIIVKPLLKIPLWHQGVGQRGWVFIDEVVFLEGDSGLLF